MSVVFRWAEGTRIKVDAQEAGEYLLVLREKYGGSLTPEVVLENARAADSPIHNAFEWDDAKAAESYRRQQAGHILRSITIVHKGKEQEPVRLFLNVHPLNEDKIPDTQLHVYIHTHDVMSDEALRQQVLRQALREIQGWQQRYKQYKELGKIFESIDITVQEKEL